MSRWQWRQDAVCAFLLHRRWQISQIVYRISIRIWKTPDRHLWICNSVRLDAAICGTSFGRNRHFGTIKNNCKMLQWEIMINGLFRNKKKLIEDQIGLWCYFKASHFSSTWRGTYFLRWSPLHYDKCVHSVDATVTRVFVSVTPVNCQQKKKTNHKRDCRHEALNSHSRSLSKVRHMAPIETGNGHFQTWSQSSTV